MTMPFGSRMRLLVASAFILALPQAALAQCTQTLSSGASIVTAVLAVASGGTVCLNAGSYPTFSSSIVKTSMTTVTTAPGVSQSQVTIASVDASTSQFLTFKNLTIGRTTVGTGTTPALHIHFVGIRFTADVCINNPANVNQDTLVDSSTFAGIGTSCTEGRLGVTGNNNTHTVSSGIVISNNVFGPGGCSDGIQITGDAMGVQILNNEFVGIKQGSCSPVHADPIQFYGAVAPIVSGNYFHGNSTGIMSPDCNGRQGTYTNNVFVTDGEYPDQIVQSGSNVGTYDHNSFVGGAGIRFTPANGCGNTSGAVVKNSIIQNGIRIDNQSSGSVFSVNDHNNGNGVGGTNAIAGTPTFVGGTASTTWSGWQLASSSVGRNAGTDGLDIGSTTFGTGAPPPPPPPPPGPKFTIGQQVLSNTIVNVRQTAAGTLLGSQPAGAVGTVTAGPIDAVLSGSTFTWWSVNFASGVDGWVGEDGLDVATSQAPSAPVAVRIVP
jgi:hypothetical protein